jgi:hypothetical protein
MVSCYLWYPDTCGIHGKDKGEGKGEGKGKGMGKGKGTGSMGMGKGMGMGMGKGENGWQGGRRERKGSDRSTRLTSSILLQFGNTHKCRVRGAGRKERTKEMTVQTDSHPSVLLQFGCIRCPNEPGGDTRAKTQR